MATNSEPTLDFKRGDTLQLDMTVSNTTNDTAVVNALVLENAEKAYLDAIGAVPQVALDVTNTLAARDVAQTAYDNSIIVDITGWTITSMIAWRGEHIDNLTTTLTNAANGEFSVTALPAMTALWETRLLETDVQFVRPEGTVSSETLYINVERDITVEVA